MELRVVHKQTEAERLRDYRQRMGATQRQKNADRMRTSRAARIPEFVCIDGEGEPKTKGHPYVLLSAYDKHGQGDYITNRRGITWEDAFEFLYGLYKKNPRASFVGFYLGYDFNHILSIKSGFPQEAAWSLLTKKGKAARLIKDGTKRRNNFRSVKVGRWEIDALGLKRIQIRPRPEGCICYELAQKCTHKQLPWMYICDAGPFYQMTFLRVIDKERWKPGQWPVTQEEFDTIKRGKDDREGAFLSPAMIAYNKLENIVLARVMEILAKGFHDIKISLAKDQWYGPGAVAQKWLRQHNAPKQTELRQKHDDKPALMPKSFWDQCRQSYFGGWFEIFSHGLILGKTYNYDIHNAYPYATSRLPHICDECHYHRGQGSYKGRGDYVLLYATVYGASNRIGPVPHRNKQGSILRPSVSKGWYWRAEIDAARRAGLVKRVITHEWSEFVPCSHPGPFKEVEDLYYKRLEVGSKTAQGMAIKLNNTSLYGKFAQSIGSAPYNDWFYASYITAFCRIQILDAIATHPGRADSVLMVATDGILFDSPHPSLPLTDKLGDWEEDTYVDVCLFKPGVYWHRDGKERLAKVKSRGVPKEEFQKAIAKVEPKFQRFLDEEKVPEWNIREAYYNEWEQSTDDDLTAGYKLWVETDGWPRFTVDINFRMKTALQALNENNWESSAQVLNSFTLSQDSNPYIKRNTDRYRDKTSLLIWATTFNKEKKRIDTTIHTLDKAEIQTYYHGEVKRPKPMMLGFGFDDGNAQGPLLEAAALLRDRPANYDLPLGEAPEGFEEWEVVWG